MYDVNGWKLEPVGPYDIVIIPSLSIEIADDVYVPPLMIIHPVDLIDGINVFGICIDLTAPIWFGVKLVDGIVIVALSPSLVNVILIGWLVLNCNGIVICALNSSNSGLIAIIYISTRFKFIISLLRPFN